MGSMCTAADRVEAGRGDKAGRVGVGRGRMVDRAVMRRRRRDSNVAGVTEELE